VALVTAQAGGTALTQRGILGGVPPREALRALTILTDVILRSAAVPEMTPSQVLQVVGKLAAEQSAGCR
jgi:hypothetical protein